MCEETGYGRPAIHAHTCPLDRVMRRELNKRGINSLKVVYSDEPPIKPEEVEGSDNAGNSGRRSTPGSTAFVPASAGLMIASEVVRDLIGV